MSTMLPQTKRTIQDLKAAGFERSDFSVRTPFNRKVQGYDVTEIYLYNKRAATDERIAALLTKGYDVAVELFSNGARNVTIEVSPHLVGRMRTTMHFKGSMQ